jgi:hypothetical protein
MSLVAALRKSPSVQAWVVHGVALLLVRRMVIGGEAKRLAGRWMVGETMV